MPPSVGVGEAGEASTGGGDGDAQMEALRGQMGGACVTVSPHMPP
eukprot:COSAG05_NODE_13969_length_412_cov_1.575080_1_plen_44_part_10